MIAMSPKAIYSKYGRIFDLMAEIIFVLDKDDMVIDNNKTAFALLGYDEFIGQPISSVVPNDGQQRFFELLQLETKTFEAQFLKKDGTRIDAEINLKQLESLGRTYRVIIAKDITEQKKRDLDFLRFSNVIQRTINPIQITDTRGLMVYVNPAFEQWSGFAKEELIGKNPKVLRSGKHTREFWQNIWRLILSGKAWHGEVQNRRKDGTLLHTDLLISPIVDDNGKVVGFLGAHRDITEQKMLEQQLVQSQKMESIGTLAAGIAHEVGNPLTSISSLVQVLQRTTNDDFSREKLELIKNQINRISRTIRDLVDFSRPSTYVERLTDVNQVIQDALNIVKYGKKVKDIDFQLDFAGDLPKLLVVPDQLTQVFINIMMNAVDSLEGKPGSIWVQTIARDSKMTIEIRDSGKGIPPDDLEKIFDPFFTTKEVGQGTGLGLWVSYGIVKNFGGDIVVDSVSGKGSTFTVLFPLKGMSNV